MRSGWDNKQEKSLLAHWIVPFTFLHSFSDRWCCGCLCPIWFEPNRKPNLFWHILHAAKFTLPDWNNCAQGMTLWRWTWTKSSRHVRKYGKIKKFSEDSQDWAARAGWRGWEEKEKYRLYIGEMFLFSLPLSCTDWHAHRHLTQFQLMWPSNCPEVLLRYW